MTDLIMRAREFATQAHTRIDQRRKYTGAPYVDHLAATAKLVGTVTDDPNVIAAAWLHDTVEDTPVTIQDIEERFGKTLASLVSDLTDVSKSGDGNRAARKAIDLAHLSQAAPDAKTVKLADLINNCVDIVAHDARFARTYLVEMEALLPVLKDGNSSLHALAEKTLRGCSQKLGRKSLLPEAPAGAAVPLATATSVAPNGTPTAQAEYQKRQSPLSTLIPHLFVDTFRAKDLASPLLSFDESMRAPEVLATMHGEAIDVIGVRRAGRVVGYATEADLTGDTCGVQMRPIGRGQSISAEGMLVDLIQILTRQDYCFVTVFGDVGAFVSRSDMNKPIVRMWLFGLITILEMYLTDAIRTQMVAEDWQSLLSRGRLEKALSLYNERRRRDIRCELVDCLQLTDKADILRKMPGFVEEFGFQTNGQVRTVTKELESLRNGLAHGQDIIENDWAQIARLGRMVESIIHRET